VVLHVFDPRTWKEAAEDARAAERSPGEKEAGESEPADPAFDESSSSESSEGAK
jgi:hypothetical protein